MKILYGVQGTGNGHISRANAMADALAHYPDIKVTWLLSGREQEQGCGSINNFLWRKGITFVVKDGSIKIIDTLRKNNLLQFRRDVKELSLKNYDMVISDFEPVISHAAKKQGIPVVGIGHQYAFQYDIPRKGSNPIVNSIMKNYAPVTTPVGLHWHHFNSPILPPILDIVIPDPLPPVQKNKVVVYLPFENPGIIQQMLNKFSSFEFYIYHPELKHTDNKHIHTRRISREGFKADLLTSGKVITNSGFELISECLQLGKEILTKPLHGQMEQLSNAQALAELGYAHVIQNLNQEEVSEWLCHENKATSIQYPDVASRLAQWINGGCKEAVDDLAASLWNAPEITGGALQARKGSKAA